MSIIADIVMLAWIPAVLLLFAVLPARRAVIVAFLAAWLFLPVVSYRLPLVPDITKMSATCAGVFIGALIFDTKRILRFVPSWVDLPIVIYCCCPMISSITNGLGVWDGSSAVLTAIETWGTPYFIGRLYFSDARALRELAIGIFISGVSYIPFCLFEIRMSPQLHKMLYGFAPGGFQMRFGGWRPSVFMNHGLELALWMTAASLIGCWLWWTGALRKVRQISAILLVSLLLITTIMCRSTGALALLFAGLGALWFTSFTKSRWALLFLIAVTPTYIFLRTTGLWNGEQVATLAGTFDEQRAQSVQFRFDNEDMLVAKAKEKLMFGWGGWGRSRVYDELGQDVSITDGLWVIELGLHGVVGLVAIFSSLLLPPLLVFSRFSARRLMSIEFAPVSALAVMTSLYAIDCLPNGMVNPVFMLAGGALSGLAIIPAAIREVTNSSPEPQVQASVIGDGIPPRRLFPKGN